MERIKIFLGLFSSGGLMTTNVNMERRHLTDNPSCSSCNLNWETTLHASRDHCHLAKSIVICFLQQILFHGWSGTLVQNLCQLMRCCGPSYSVWRCGTYGYGRVARNARVFGNNNIPADCIVSVIRGLAVDIWKNKSEDMCRGGFRSWSTKWGGNSLLKMV